MKGIFHKLFNIYSGEEKNAFLFACLGFLWALAVTSGLKFSDALFLIHVGASSLPTVYMCIACGMMILAAFLLKAFNSMRAHSVLMTALLIGATFYAFAYFCLLNNIGVESKWIWYALRIFGTLFFTIIITCFWTFVDQYYHLQDAKRLYCLFSSSIFLGIATTGFLMRSGLIEFQHMILCIILLLFFTVYWIKNIVAKAKPVYDENQLETNGEQADVSFRSVIRAVLSSKFTLLLMTSNFLIYVLQIITEYSYMISFERHFDPSVTSGGGGEEAAQLTMFLGKCVAGVSIFNLVFGLFIYSRLMRRFGINNLLMYTPIVLFIAFNGWILNDSLVFPIMGFFVVEGMLYIIDDGNFTLLLNAVPSKLKYKIRLFIESFFEPIGMLFSSLLITFIPIDSKKLGLILAACALGVALLMRKQYLKAIYINLSDNAIHFQRSIFDWFSRLPAKEQQVAERRLLAILQCGDERSQLFALEGLLGFKDTSILERLLKYANALTPSMKVHFITLVGQSAFAEDHQVIHHFQTWRHTNQDPGVQGVLHFYLARQGLLPQDHAIHLLNSEDLTLKGAAIIALKKSAVGSACFPFSAQLEENLRKLLHSDKEPEICMAMTTLGCESLPKNVEVLIPFLKHGSLTVNRHAAASIALIADKQSAEFAPYFLTELSAISDTELRQSYLKVLGNIGDYSHILEIIKGSTHFRPNERRLTEATLFKYGEDSVPMLLAITKDIAMHDRSRVLAGKVLGRLALSQLREHLYEIITAEIERAYFYFYHHHSIQAEYPEIDLTMLKDALLSSFYSVQDFIIQLLGVAGESEDCELLSHSLRSPNHKVRSHVLDTLEKTCEAPIFRALYPLIADLPKNEKIQAYLRGGRIPLNLVELLDKMSVSQIQGDQIVATTVKYRLNLPNWRESLIEQMKTHKETFNHFAYELLET
jgi:HEAT repeat protein